MQTDILVVGSGIAGLTFALQMARRHPDSSITILTKANPDETNTKYAQGGIAVVSEETDSYEEHIRDTLISGDGLCDREIVELVVREGTERVQEMIEWGTEFDKNEDGEYMRGREGGHSKNRILHYKDITGWEIEKSLLEAVAKCANIQIINHYFVVDIISQHHLGYLVLKTTNDIACYGVYALNMATGAIEKILAKVTLMATGGCGQVYRATTNPRIATGDGIAMVHRAKGRVENMEFIQFHPTALYQAGVSPSFLITEAVRGDGGILRNHKGEAFMQRYDAQRLDLAPRDVVARAIDSEMKIAGVPYMYLDCTHMDQEKFSNHFPNILKKCADIGIDIVKQYIPISPAAHYCCGGIESSEYGQSSIRHLYVAGECTSTGLHGANRLASNSLLEAVVFAHRCAIAASAELPELDWQDSVPAWSSAGTTEPKEMILITQTRKELTDIMSDYVGIVRNDVRLERAMRRLRLLHEETEELYQNTTLSPQLAELRNLLEIAYLIVKGAMYRKESRGLHYNTDYPYKSAHIENIVL